MYEVHLTTQKQKTKRQTKKNHKKIQPTTKKIQKKKKRRKKKNKKKKIKKKKKTNTKKKKKKKKTDKKKKENTTQKNKKKNEKKTKKKKYVLSKKMKNGLMFEMGVFCSFWNEIHGVLKNIQVLPISWTVNPFLLGFQSCLGIQNTKNKYHIKQFIKFFLNYYYNITIQNKKPFLYACLCSYTKK